MTTKIRIPAPTAPTPRAVVAESGRTKVVAIGGVLHSFLKARAAREDVKLQDLVEAKLRELLSTEELAEMENRKEIAA